MFSDIVESTALYEQLGDLRGSELIRTHNEIFRREVAAHRGHEVNTFGDSFMIAFSSVRRAVLCAIALQRAFAAYSDSHPDLPMQVRIGLHVGEAVRESTGFLWQGRDSRRAHLRTRSRRSDLSVVDASRRCRERGRSAFRAGRREAAQGLGGNSSIVRTYVVAENWLPTTRTANSAAAVG
jgi:class 3 adenylate cyclase